VAGFTKSHEITLLVASAFGEREDVVYLFSWSETALFLALLTKRVRFDVAVTDAFPCTTVSFIGDRVTFILIVMFVHCFLMLGTVLLTFSKPTAAGISTRTLWFVGHHFTSLLGIEKALQDEPTRLGIYSISLII
jgi:hypothetical protein